MNKLYLVFLMALSISLFSCRCEEKGKVETSPSKDKNVREYNLNVKEEQARTRTPCDTLALQQYIIDNYPAGTYLVLFEKTYTFTVQKPAVIYYNPDKRYVFAVLAKSKEGERYIETKNIIGFESSFINLDSTKLGTAFFYLTLFQCDNGNFKELWESEVPIHGGFNTMKLKRWKYKNTLYVELNFDAGIISGHRNYNYFLIDGIDKKPHLMETYVGIAHKRTLAKVNDDKYPDYYEYRFIDTLDYNRLVDSIPFYWSEKKQEYVTDVNRRWHRKY